MAKSGCVYVLRLTGYNPRDGAPSGLVKVGCSSDVARRVASLSTPESFAEHVPEATLHPLLHSSAELAALARERYLSAELVFVSALTQNKYSLEKAVHGELDRLGLRVVERRELFFWSDLAEALTRRVCAVGRELTDYERDDVARQVSDPTRPLLCEECGS